jgi:hypothetical protein
MRPNTPHVTIALEDAIILGGHFYSFANLQHTLSGIIHSFMLGGLIADTMVAHQGHTRFLLFRMLRYLYKFFVQGADRRR